MLGIDPGAHGALVVIESETRAIVHVADMPTWTQIVGAKGAKRLRIDAMGLIELFETYKLLSVKLVVMEAVGGRGKQPGSSGFIFGYGVGMLYMGIVYAGFPIETVAPHTWKAMLRVPGKQRADDSAIVNRACELFPNSRAHFTGQRGGLRVDRAEAAMLALWGADHVLHRTVVTLDPERDLAYRTRVQAADTGA